MAVVAAVVVVAVVSVVVVVAVVAVVAVDVVVAVVSVAVVTVEVETSTLQSVVPAAHTPPASKGRQNPIPVNCVPLRGMKQSYPKDTMEHIGGSVSHLPLLLV